MTNNKWIEVYNNEHTHIFPVKNITDIIRDIKYENERTYYMVAVIVADKAGVMEYIWRYKDEINAYNLYEMLKRIVWGAYDNDICYVHDSVYLMKPIDQGGCYDKGTTIH